MIGNWPPFISLDVVVDVRAAFCSLLMQMSVPVASDFL